MTGQWPTIDLGSVAEFRNGLNYTQAARERGGLPIIGVKDFQSRSFVEFDDLEELDPAIVDPADLLVEKGDVLFVRSNGNRQLIGRSLLVRHKPTRPTTFSGFTIRVRFSDQKCDPRFYAYVLRGPVIRQALSSQGGGTNISNLNQTILARMTIPLPTKDEQYRIASILGAYDDLIEINRRRIALLEDMAQRLFEEWFVRFRFPGHEGQEPDQPPRGWQKGVIGDIVQERRDKTSPGEHLSERVYVPIECIGRRTLALVETKPWHDAQSSLQLFERNDILFGAMRPYFHKVCHAPTAGITRTTCFVLRPRAQFSFAFSTLALFRDKTVAFATANSTGSTIPYAKWAGSLERLPIAIPPDDVLANFDALVRPLLDLI